MPLFKSSKIHWAESELDGKWKWTMGKEVLKPELDWEMIGTKRVGSPYVFQDMTTSKWKMFYSASSVHLDDANVDEPLHHGMAESDDLRGPYTRVTNQPIFFNNGEIPNTTILGVGSLKLIKGYN